MFSGTHAFRFRGAVGSVRPDELVVTGWLAEGRETIRITGLKIRTKQARFVGRSVVDGESIYVLGSRDGEKFHARRVIVLPLVVGARTGAGEPRLQTQAAA